MTNRPDAGLPRLLTVDELATYLRVNRTTIYRLAGRGDLPGFRIGTTWRFRLAEIDELFARRTWITVAGGLMRRNSRPKTGGKIP